MITDMLRRALLAGIGIQEKFRETIDDLVKKGELSQSQGAKLVKEWTESAEKSAAEMNKTFMDMMERALERMNLPSKQDIERLNRKVQSLSIRVKRLEGKTEELEEEVAEEEEET
jgi:poly(hydroxyalkanoate) granule-associated protein